MGNKFFIKEEILNGEIRLEDMRLFRPHSNFFKIIDNISELAKRSQGLRKFIVCSSNGIPQMFISTCRGVIVSERYAGYSDRKEIELCREDALRRRLRRGFSYGRKTDLNRWILKPPESARIEKPKKKYVAKKKRKFSGKLIVRSAKRGIFEKKMRRRRA